MLPTPIPGGILFIFLHPSPPYGGRIPLREYYRRSILRSVSIVKQLSAAFQALLVLQRRELFPCDLCVVTRYTGSMTTHELLDRIRKSRGEVKTLIEGAPADQLERLPGPKPEWTAKDLLAHLSYWEHPTLDKRAGRTALASWGDVHATNEELLRKSRRRSVADVLREFAESGQRIIEEIERLSDDDLLNDSPWNDGKRLWEHLADDTCVHYEEHLPALRAWARIR